jgi:alpha-beta hydrolase superfamily lysophospholipase
MRTPELSLISLTTAPDGTQLASYRWQAARTRPARPAYIMHGLGEYAGRYTGVVRWLAERGWSAAAHDHRGHGRSSGLRGALITNDDLINDAEHLLMEYLQQTGEAPLLVGHDLGALVATHVAQRGKVPLAGLVLSAPAFDIELSAMQRWKLSMLGALSPDTRINTGGNPSKRSHNMAVVDAYAADPLIHDRVSARMVNFIREGGSHAIEHAGELPCRTLMMVAGEDVFAPPATSRRFADAAAPGKLALRWYPQAFHEIFNEAPELSKPIYADFETWLDTLQQPHNNSETQASDLQAPC